MTKKGMSDLIETLVAELQKASGGKPDAEGHLKGGLFDSNGARALLAAAFMSKKAELLAAALPNGCNGGPRLSASTNEVVPTT